MSTDEHLYQQGVGGEKAALASRPENDRVRELLAAELEHLCPGDEGKARGIFAKRWVALAHQLGLKSPGADQRARLRPGQTKRQREEEAARTRLRQIREGHLEFDWVLVGIEATINDRKGLALPGKAYETQERLDV